jgi:hypothetical protein
MAHVIRVQATMPRAQLLKFIKWKFTAYELQQSCISDLHILVLLFPGGSGLLTDQSPMCYIAAKLKPRQP